MAYQQLHAWGRGGVGHTPNGRREEEQLRTRLCYKTFDSAKTHAHERYNALVLVLGEQVVAQVKVRLDHVLLALRALDIVRERILAVPDQQVREPAHAEHKVRLGAEKVRHRVDDRVALAQRVKHLLLVDVARVAVVVRVRQLPRVVRHENEAVQQVAERVVERLAAREGAVAAVCACNRRIVRVANEGG